MKTIIDKIEDEFNYKIKKYEEHIDGLKELECPEPVLEQVISIYAQLCNDKHSLSKYKRLDEYKFR